jgi:tetratricopeptide (TPR) repeat protein
MSKVMVKQHGQAQKLSDTASQAFEFAMKEATRLSDAGELDDAWALVDKQLTQTPSDPLALLVASHIMEKAGKVTVAYSLADRVTSLKPDRPEGWINKGRCADTLWRVKEAEECYRKALELCENNKQKLLILTNLAAVLIQDARFAEAEPIARQALIIDPNDAKSRHNLGTALLARRQWQQGWKYYSASVGTSARRLVKYGEEPVWNGEKGKTVVVYGEQGLGDEIVFASMYKELIRDCKKVILDCDPRLAALFRRSFPEASVYGTRNSQYLDWAEEDRHIDASISSGELGKFYRIQDDQFTADPYLKPDPDRVAMWKALFKSKGVPCIGLAWSGGIWKTGSPFRTIPKDAFTSLLSMKAHFVNLQYKPGDTIEGVAQYGYATLTQDYDDTAAMVAALDAVVSVPTTVVHLAAAIGTPVYALQSSKPCWKFAGGLAWHPWVTLINGDSWDVQLAEVKGLLCK